METTVLLAAGWVNATWGWGLILAGFAAGAGVGMGFHGEGFLGGYGSFRRRLLRLGHVALVMLGVLNALFAATATAPGEGWVTQAASVAWMAGGVLMPAVCFLTAWRAGFRHWFAVPVVVLMAAVALTMMGGGQ